MKLRKLILLLAGLALVAAACGGTDAGTEDNPIQVLFVPSVSAAEIIAGRSRKTFTTSRS